MEGVIGGKPLPPKGENIPPPPPGGGNVDGGGGMAMDPGRPEGLFGDVDVVVAVMVFW